MRTSSRIQAADLATQSNEHYLNGKQFEKDRVFYDARLKLVTKCATALGAVFLIIAYIVITLCDAWAMFPIISVAVMEGFTKNQWLLIPAIVFYLAIVITLSLMAGKGLAKKYNSKFVELEAKLEELDNPDQPPPIIKRAIMASINKQFKQGVTYMVGLLIFIGCLAAIRNRYLNGAEGPFGVQLSTPTHWLTTIVLPLGLAIFLCYLAMYKDVVYKLIIYSRRKRRAEKQKRFHFTEARALGYDAVALEAEAKKLGETMLHSKELRIVLQRYTDESVLDGYPQSVTVIITKGGAPVSHIQVNALAEDHTAVFGISDEKGIAILKWTTPHDLKLILVQNIPLRGDKFEDGQEIPVDLDVLKSTSIS